MGLEEYLQLLEGKGFQFGEDAIGFIYFGKQYTDASDELARTALELTLKAQKRFDGSFYVSLLEMFKSNQITTRAEALKFIKEKNILAV
ncbi:hypothetical protein EKG37_13525 [Robertmurraya yapensis]|uniref:Group-specific protein n=2 Tax=Bacillaceae TaxID=186817 RepID=A0A431W599_9BACI|nr:DUF6123 family protein [Bacillus yapensis]RTR30514.1 hypothetical protein EKG37_13525 [Bacillus yapensis]TKS95333.1 hypothetical protein FAR12_13525 [Bacillus yapensis]